MNVFRDKFKNIDSAKAANIMFETYEYDAFKPLKGNRDISPSHVKRIVKSMKIKQLKIPIIVNENFEIIDGQHTLEAIKELRLPVYYIIVKDYGIKECQEFNIARKNWSYDDYVDTNVKIGNEEYVKFLEFKQKYPEINNTTIYKYLLQNSATTTHGRERDTFKAGEFKIKDYDIACLNAEKMIDFQKCKKVWGSQKFMQAIFNIIRFKSYNHKRMIHKLDYLSTEIEKSSSMASYYQQLTKIYNYKNVKAEHVDFFYELYQKQPK